MAHGPTVEECRSQPPHPARVAGGSRLSRRDPALPLVSVVSICRNSEDVIGRCIASVAAQDYPNIEFIIFDGASTDGTVDILRRHDGDISLWISEPDKGRNPAFNKALAAATGDYLTVVMADDWLEPDFVRESVAALARHGVDYVFGDRMLHDPSGQVLYRQRGEANFADGLATWMTVNSPSFTIRRQMLDEIGLFNDISVASDYDWFLRAHIAGQRGAYDPAILYHFQTGGLSSFNAFRAYRDNMMLARKYGAGRVSSFLVFARYIFRHCFRDVLGMIMPAGALLAIRRWRQKLKGSGS